MTLKTDITYSSYAFEVAGLHELVKNEIWLSCVAHRRGKIVFADMSREHPVVIEASIAWMGVHSGRGVRRSIVEVNTRRVAVSGPPVAGWRVASQGNSPKQHEHGYSSERGCISKDLENVVVERGRWTIDGWSCSYLYVLDTHRI